MRDLCDFVRVPLLECHVLLAQREQTPCEADRLIAQQDLPDKEFLVLLLVFRLSLLFSLSWSFRFIFGCCC